MLVTTQKELRAVFWANLPDHLTGGDRVRVTGKTQNQYPTDTRMAWCDFVEYMRISGQISAALANRVTL